MFPRKSSAARCGASFQLARGMKGLCTSGIPVRQDAADLGPASLPVGQDRPTYGIPWFGHSKLEACSANALLPRGFDAIPVHAGDIPHRVVDAMLDGAIEMIECLGMLARQVKPNAEVQVRIK